ncbi:MAG: hypothetical protein JXX28_14760 [Deltaproteobacteria bacterium]|nr:hypothetical protein [Deltaproteobacteria bacterium]
MMKWAWMVAALGAVPAACAGTLSPVEQAPAEAAWEPMALAAEGSITVSGGCIAHQEGVISFRPRPGGVTEVEYAGSWFSREGGVVPNYKIELPSAEVAPFFGALKRMLDEPTPSQSLTTRNAVVSVKLPLEQGLVEVTWREGDRRVQVDPLLNLLSVFVVEKAPKPSPL